MSAEWRRGLDGWRFGGSARAAAEGLIEGWMVGWLEGRQERPPKGGRAGRRKAEEAE